MFDKLKNLFKLNNWKRIAIVAFSFILVSLFIGLSFGLYSKKTLPSSQYQSGVQLVVKPTKEDFSPFDKSDEQFKNQIYFNLYTRLKQEYPNNNVEIKNEGNSINVKISGIDSQSQKVSLVKNIIDKDKLVLTSVNSVGANDILFDNLNPLMFNVGSPSAGTNEYSLYFYQNGKNYSSFDVYKKGTREGVKNVVIWKNFDILKKIVNEDLVGFNEAGRNYYKYLFFENNAPLAPNNQTRNGEDNNSQNEENNSENNEKYYFFKNELKYNGEIYHPTDFIVSINDIGDFNNKETITVKKSFGVSGWTPSSNDVEKESFEINYWVSPYNLSDYSLSNFTYQNTQFPFLLVSLISFFALVSIYVVISYGYLGIIAILLLAVIVFLSLLMITMLIGDYDSASVFSLLISTLISFEFVILFLEKIKKEVNKGNSISKSVKTTINLTNKNDYIKAFCLAISMAICYTLLSLTYFTFSAIVLSSIVAIPFILLLAMRVISKVFSNINYFENNKKAIYFYDWKLRRNKNNSKVINSLGETREFNETNIVDEIKQEIKVNNEIETTKKYKLFTKINRKGLLLSIASITYLIFGGLIIFLISFFRTGNGFTIANADSNKIVLLINSNKNNSFTNNELSEIKNNLYDNGIKDKNIEVTSNGQIKVYFDTDIQEKEINKIASVLISKYGVQTISEEISSSQTFKIMKYTMYGILIALIIMCLIILLWLGWTKAISFFVMSLTYIISVIAILMFGFVSVSPFVSILIIASFILFIQTTLSSLIRYSQKIKMKRIEEMEKSSIDKLIDFVTFKNIKSALIISCFAIVSFLLMMVFLSISWELMLFMIAITIFTTIFNILLLPKLLSFFEVKRARIKRNRIITQFWETEKVKEQTFSGINNIK